MLTVGVIAVSVGLVAGFGCLLLLALVAAECGFANGFVSWLIVELVAAGWVCVLMFASDSDVVVYCG